MRIYPDQISVNVVKSHAERRVFAALKALPDDTGVALHSVNLPEHAYKRMGEIDFVIVTPDVLLIVEVKGGPISRVDGKWRFGGRYGPPGIKDEGPFDQAKSAMHELERELRGPIGSLRMAKVATGFLVITTDVDLPQSTEWDDDTYLGARGWAGGRGLAAALGRARRFWQERNSGVDKLIPTAVRTDIVNAIRPEFERVPTLATRANELDARFTKLTTEEMEFFDRFSANSRIRCEGGAGSGKTYVAAEAARRRASEGRVLVTCASPLLARFLQSRLDLPNITVIPFDEIARIGSEPYDVLVVDEAQDLMSFDALDGFDRCLKGGLEQGSWVIMLDPNNQLLDSARYDEEAYGHLASIPQTVVRLSRNCRNTQDIVRQTQLQTAADLGVAMAGEGIPVIYRDVADATDEATELDDYLKSLRDEDVRPKDITVVSMSGDWERSSARLSSSRMVRLSEVVGTDKRPDRVIWASVEEIKGLENSFVCVIDLDETTIRGRLDALYVAMTRPRTGLWLALRPESKAVLKRIAESGLRRRMGGGLA